MKSSKTLRTFACGSLLLAPATPLCAADEPPLRVKLEEPPARNKNRFGVSYRASFTIDADFRNVGNLGKSPRGAGPGPNPVKGDRVNRDYDDGFVHADTPHNDFGVTQTWGVKDASQIDENFDVHMSSTTGRSVNPSTYDDDPQHGFELTYNRELGRGAKNNWSWGVEGAFGWTDIEIVDNRRLVGGTKKITDTYGLGFPQEQGRANPNFPGWYYAEETDEEYPQSSIPDVPESRSVSTKRAGSVITGERRFDADLFIFRLGPYIDLPIDDHFTVSLSGGFAMGIMDGKFSYNQVITTEANRTAQRASHSKTDVLFGGYLSATIHYAINECWDVFVGGQYIGLCDYEVQARGQRVKIDLSKTAHFVAGLSYSF
jgi:hypothetical protein